MQERRGDVYSELGLKERRDAREILQSNTTGSLARSQNTSIPLKETSPAKSIKGWSNLSVSSSSLYAACVTVSSTSSIEMMPPKLHSGACGLENLDACGVQMSFEDTAASQSQIVVCSGPAKGSWSSKNSLAP